MAWNYGKPNLRPHVCACIPHHGNVSLEWADLMYAPLKGIQQPDFDKSVKLARGILNLDTERNVLVNYALQDPSVTHILFVDTDVLIEKPKPDINEGIRALLSCHAPIASGIYRAKKKEGFPWAFWMRNPNGQGLMNIDKWSGNWLECDFIGFGFVLIERQVFERLNYPWFLWQEPEPSEDFYFCIQAKAAGFPCKVFTDVQLAHIGQVKISADTKTAVLGI